MNLAPVNRIYKISVLQDSRNAAVAASLNNRMGQVARSTGQVTKNARGAALATRNLGYVAQNASYQIADFFVMLQGGVGVGRALATQLPQLLAGFGAFGAVLGAVAAIGASVVVMLQQQGKVFKDIEQIVEDYERVLEGANSALDEFLKNGDYTNRTLLQIAQTAERIQRTKIREALAPPDPTAWEGFLALMQRALDKTVELVNRFTYFGKALKLLGVIYDDKIAPPLIEIAEANDLLGKQLQRLALNAATAGTDLKSLNENTSALFLTLAQYEGNPALDTFNLLPTALEQTEQAVDGVRLAFSVLYDEDSRKWPDEAKQQFALLTSQLEKTRIRTEEITKEIVRLTQINPETGFLEALTRRTPLEEAIQRIRAEEEQLIITSTDAERAIEALTEIDRWEKLQDVIIDIGKNFENQIVNAMKTGKFAVKDFVAFALEQFARLALSRVFEPFFLLLANSVPALGGSPSPGTGVPIGARAMTIEPPPSAAPMYNYGGSISRVPGASRSMGGVQANNVTVNVNNYGNDEVEVKQQQTSNGVEIDVLIKNTVRQGFASGDFDRVMASSYGARRLAY